MSKCPNCGSQVGVKLSRRFVAILAQRFFVWGTIKRADYGASPSVQLNGHQTTSIEVAPWLEADLRLIEQTLQVGFFYYAPRLWMIGEVEPLKALRNVTSRGKLISRILNEYPTRVLDSDEYFYRMRKAPTNPGAYDQYDAPPDGKLGQGRFEVSGLPILYGSQDLEVCLHECRVAADDELYVATLVPVRKLKLLNLAHILEEQNVTEFESLDMAIHMLFLAGPHSYEISREIACAAQKHGFDGIVYPSYFTLLRTGGIPFETTYGISLRRMPELREFTRKKTISNLALFGRPIADGSVTVKCINRVILNKVEYNLHFGPLLPREDSSNYVDPTDPSAVLKIMGERTAAIWDGG
jgi:RES domain